MTFSEILSLFLNPLHAAQGLRDFLEMGGGVLVIILIATFALWTLILERYWYFTSTHHDVKADILQQWEARKDHNSWAARRVRDRLISQIRMATTRNLSIIKVLVALAPLFGLLGTVTGMVEVFDVMAITGSGNARAMAAGISKATLPTMAGMVAALSGIYFSARLERRAHREVQFTIDGMGLR